MAPSNATRCACYENLQGSNAYFLGVIAGRKEAKEAMQEAGRWLNIDARDVGKTVFLTREEAENALEDWRR